MPSVYTISGAPFGQESVAPPGAPASGYEAVINAAEDEIDQIKKQSWYIAGGSAVIGVLIGVFVGIAVKGS